MSRLLRYTLKPGISAAHLVCRSALSVRSSSAHGLPGRFAPDAPLQTASVYVKIVLDTQNCILFCVFKFLFGTFAQNPSLMFVGFVVVPLAGSVDRNRAIQEPPPWLTGRSPLRGVWIEIMVRLASWGTCAVAPLAGSVDRNTTVYTDYANYNRSLPSRGAWIEMGSSCPGGVFGRSAHLPGCRAERFFRLP